ncbi:MAG: pyroglutamyl-peptidase I [Beijerinckiaceae bacterium]
MTAPLTRLLLTGFGSFPGAPSNPTQALVRSLPKHYGRSLALAGIDLRAAVLPVAYAEVEAALRGLIVQHRPDIVLHLGLAARRRVVSIETRAKNRLNTIHPDASRRFSGRLAVSPGRDNVRRARWPSARLAAAVSRNGFPAELSIDAGDYLCNQALYLSLGLHEGLCGFIHVPKLRKKWRVEAPLPEAERQPLHPIPSVADIERSIASAIRLLAVEHRRRARDGAISAEPAPAA